jgi:cytochrome c peroxidase
MQIEHRLSRAVGGAGAALLLLALAAAGCGGSSGSPDATSIPTPSDTPTPTVAPTADLVAEGTRIFFQETFDGNGRTCGTCHPAQANFTLTPAFIASLPPDDPLFVAERNPALAALESPDLMHGPRGLILENVDGFDQPPVFRGVPHIFDLAFSAPFGWSGTIPFLRDFAPRAIEQHFPRTLNRVPGVDFRLPTEFELDALEAFMLSTVLPADGTDGNFVLDLDSFVTTPAQARGRDLFLGGAKCSLCHTLPFLTSGLVFDTGVTRLAVNTVPPPECDPPCDPLGPREAGGARAFNIPTLFGLENTAPFFHDNSAATLRDAVAFYTGAEFQPSPGGAFAGGIQMTDAEIDDVVAFLEALTPCGNGVADHGEPCDDGTSSSAMVAARTARSSAAAMASSIRRRSATTRTSSTATAATRAAVGAGEGGASGKAASSYAGRLSRPSRRACAAPRPDGGRRSAS